MLEVTSDDTPDGQPDGHGMLLARRHRYTGTLSYYRCWTPDRTSRGVGSRFDQLCARGTSDLNRSQKESLCKL